MSVPQTHLTTEFFPATISLLTQHLPSVLDTTCYNECCLPFCEEVKCTELGHLFEHILLDYLCQEKIRLGADSATYEGETSWNWKKEVRGTFHISILISADEELLLHQALHKTCLLMEKIMSSSARKTQMAVVKPSVWDMEYPGYSLTSGELPLTTFTPNL